MIGLAQPGAFEGIAVALPLVPAADGILQRFEQQRERASTTNINKGSVAGGIWCASIGP